MLQGWYYYPLTVSPIVIKLLYSITFTGSYGPLSGYRQRSVHSVRVCSPESFPQPTHTHLGALTRLTFESRP